ncbi:hypothetical protein D3C87_1700870 [compost metagenome]
MTHHAFQLVFHPFRQIRARLEEVFKIRRREDQHFTRPVGAIEVSPLPRFEHIGPALEIFQLLLRPLGEEVVGDADRHLLFGMQLFDDFVIFRVILETAARINRTG